MCKYFNEVYFYNQSRLQNYAAPNVMFTNQTAVVTSYVHKINTHDFLTTIAHIHNCYLLLSL